MEVIILGSGSYQPDLKRHASGYLVKIGGENLVFDFGRGTIDQLLKLGITYQDVDRIFISHIHSDHMSELIPLFHIAFNEPIQIKKRSRALYIYGPQGLKKCLKMLANAIPGLDPKNANFKLTIEELSQSKVEGKKWRVSSFIVSHSPKIKCLAYRIESGGRILAYSGDTGDCPGIYRVVKNADVAIIESSWPKAHPGEHLSATQAAQIAQKFHVRKLILTHFSPYYEKNFDIKKEAAEKFKGPIILAKDLMRIKV